MRFTVAGNAAVSSLAGVPAIVFGLFGLGFFVQFVMNMEGDHMGGEYQVDNHVTGFDANHLIAWKTAPRGTEPRASATWSTASSTAKPCWTQPSLSNQPPEELE